MSEIELKARELLAAEYRELGIEPQAARLMEQGHQPGGVHYCAVQAIKAALAPQWQPIESAPKDGARVLLWDSAGDGRAITGAWRVDSADDHETFTHWQPLPAPPEVEG